MKTTSPLISVAMPVYNAQRFLAEAMESLLAQTLAAFEVVTINDGSTDASGQILENFAKRDPRVRVITTPNGGVAKALNRCIDEARGKYLARMDADDVAMPDRFEKQAAYLDAHAECVCVGGQVMVIEPFGSPLHVAEHALDHETIDRELMNGRGWAMVHPAVMMRRQAVIDAGKYRLQYNHSEDLDLFLRLAERGKMANLPDVVLRYRHHPSSANHTRYAEQCRIKRDIVREAHERRGLTLASDWTFVHPAPLPLPELFTKWAWAALKAGNATAARKHAATAVKKSPLSMAAWKVMLCAVRGH